MPRADELHPEAPAPKRRGRPPKAKAQAMATDAAKGFEGKAYRILQGIARPRAMVDWPIRSKG